MTRIDNSRVIRSPHGTELSAKSWLTEAPLRMLMNNLDPEVAENPNELVVYGGISCWSSSKMYWQPTASSRDQRLGSTPRRNCS